MAKHLSTVVIACLAAALLCSGAAASGSTFVPRKDGLSCNSICSSQGLTSATQRSFDSPAETSVCSANVTGQGMLSGYQQGGNGTCNVVSKGEASAFDEYSCLCLDSQATPGLASAGDSTCSSACSSQDYDGLTGAAVSTDSSEPSYTCVPSSEIGELNRFGYTTELEAGMSICTAAIDGTATATPDFSCFCAFLPTSSQQGTSSDTSATDSSSASVATQSLSTDSDAVAAGG